MPFSTAFIALMQRNLLYRRRKIVGSIFEWGLPILFLFALVGIKSAAENSEFFKTTTVPPQLATNEDTFNIFSFTDYVAAIHGKRYCNTGFFDLNFNQEDDDWLITGIPYTGFDWPVPFVKCDSRPCTEIGEEAIQYCEYPILALAPSSKEDIGGKERVNNFKDYVYGRYPQLQNENKTLPFSYDFVQIFESSDAIDDYVRSKGYGKSNNPKIAVGVIFSGNNEDNYDYTIRVNSTNYNAPERDGRAGATTTPDTGKLFSSYAKSDSESCTGLIGDAMQGTLSNSCTGKYMYNGALATQRLVNDFIMVDSGSKDAGYYVSEHGVQYVPFPTLEYETTGFYSAFGAFAPLLITIGLLYPVAVMIRFVVTEKGLRQKELMKMMSATEGDIELSWFMSFLIFHVLTIIACAMLSSSVFPNSDFVYIILLWVLFFIALILFSQALSCVTSKPIRGVLIGLLVFFSGTFITNAQTLANGKSTVLELISLHPLAALSYAVQEIARLEDAGVGANSASIFATDNSSGFTFFIALRCLVTSSLFWGTIMWYLNRVIPPDYGQALPFYFPFTLSYWMPWKNNMSEESELNTVEDDKIPIEQVPDVLRNQAKERKSIEIHNLRKEFKEKTAVDGLNLSIYSGQITALLGHNGAGKTTTINMLTGAMAPSAGHAIVGGKNIRTQMKNIRKEIGICLQHNCLFPQMTVYEHIQFFCRLKGVNRRISRKELAEKINQTIRDVGLWEKRNTFSSKLSGGMKRKLSLAIAFCGDSKMVLLDEPTSGMDPFARRFTWNILRKYRQDRCIILTTHSMDEADILGDRIAIMAEGRLRCVGSSLFLKKTFGVGYQLTIEKKNQSGIEKSNDQNENETTQNNSTRNCGGTKKSISSDSEIMEIITGAVSEAKILNNVGTELSYQLPLGSSGNFVPMFEKLDQAKERGNIESYGVSVTTLDEVFQIIARDHDAKKHSKLVSGTRIGSYIDTDDNSSLHSHMDLEKNGLFFRHFLALFKKRAANFRRDKRAWFCTTILPSIFVCLGLVALKYSNSARSLEALPLDLNDYNAGMEPRNPIPFNVATSTYTCQPGKCAYMHDELHVFNTGESFYFCGSQSRLDNKAVCSIEESNDILDRITTAGSIPIGESVSDIRESSRSILQTKDSFAASQYGAIYFTHEKNSEVTFAAGKENANNASSSYGELVYQKCLNKTGDYFMESECENYKGLGYVISYNFTALHIVPLYQTLADEAIVRHALGKDNFRISTTIHPLPITHTEKRVHNASDAFSLWFVIVLSFPFIAGAFATFVVTERESKAKHLQVVAGVKPLAYWLSTFFWDLMNYQIPLWITVILMFAFGAEVFTTTEKDAFFGVLSLLFLFGPAAAAFSYCVSHAFTSPSMCNVFIIITGFVIGMGGPVISLMLRMIGMVPSDPKENLTEAAEILEWVLRLFPSFCLGKGLFYVIHIDFIQFWYWQLDITAFDKAVLQYEVIFLVLQTFVYLTAAIYIDILSGSPRAVAIWNKFIGAITYVFKMNLRKQSNASSPPDDIDVIAEQERVANGDAENDSIVIRNFSKVYGDGKVAVNNLSLGIPPGQCFGLLGINGAGKTTTMGMLTAEFPPTSGDATLAGYSVCREPDKTRRRIGYCPQFDAHFSNMTGREHVELYAAIKGIPKKSVTAASLSKLKEVGLNKKDSDRLSSQYSGGMKRRLSLACATIGRPQIVFLDECSTGVDPVARREIWQMISDMITSDNVPDSEKTSVILTTHSMEECEALCPRIGIMANGKLRCLGSAQHLKTKFGRGYQIEMSLKNVEKEDEDYKKMFLSLGQQKHGSDESESAAIIDGKDIFFTLEEAKTALHRQTGDDSLSKMIAHNDVNGYLLYKDAISESGVTLDDLASFATSQTRANDLDAFIQSTYPSALLRERQDLKSRYELSSEHVRLSEIFSVIEEKKGTLSLSDYGVSQTSLEQVFNMHAAEAEDHKCGGCTTKRGPDQV